MSRLRHRTRRIQEHNGRRRGVSGRVGKRRAARVQRESVQPIRNSIAIGVGKERIRAHGIFLKVGQPVPVWISIGILANGSKILQLPPVRQPVAIAVTIHAHSHSDGACREHCARGRILDAKDRTITVTQWKTSRIEQGTQGQILSRIYSSRGRADLKPGLEGQFHREGVLKIIGRSMRYGKACGGICLNPNDGIRDAANYPLVVKINVACRRQLDLEGIGRSAVEYRVKPFILNNRVVPKVFEINGATSQPAPERRDEIDRGRGIRQGDISRRKGFRDTRESNEALSCYKKL